MRELSFLFDSVMALVVGAFLLRLLCQLIRTDFRNPLVQAIVKITNPLILPLRRILPPIGRIDTASAVAVLIAQLVRTTLKQLLVYGFVPPAARLLCMVLLELVDTTLVVYIGALILYVVLGWVAPDTYSPAGRVLDDLVGPLLRPFRRAIPAIGGLDLSPLFASLLLIVLRMVLNDRIGPLLLGG
jgi:YggT family protein